MSESKQGVCYRLVAVCRAGFDSPEHHRNWWKKHAAEIRALPPSMGDQVRAAWEQATHKAFSKGAARG